MGTHDKIFEAIANKYGKSIEEVRNEICTAIASAYKEPNLYAQAVPRKNAVPTTEEFIDFICMKLLRQNQDDNLS